MLPMFSALSLQVIRLLESTWLDASRINRFANLDVMLAAIIIFHFLAGAMLGAVTGSAIYQVALGKNDLAKGDCLCAGWLLLILQLLFIWLPLVHETRPRRIFPPDFLEISLLLGAPLAWTLALIIYGTRRHETDESQNTRRE